MCVKPLPFRPHVNCWTAWRLDCFSKIRVQEKKGYVASESLNHTGVPVREREARASGGEGEEGEGEGEKGEGRGKKERGRRGRGGEGEKGSLSGWNTIFKEPPQL